MVAFDGSEKAERALAIAKELSKLMTAELHIFSSLEEGGESNGSVNRLSSILKDTQIKCRASGIICRIEISDNELSAAENIINYAKNNSIDQIVLGLRKRSKVGKMLLGSTSRTVILEASCPVLTVK